MPKPKRSLTSYVNWAAFLFALYLSYRALDLEAHHLINPDVNLGILAALFGVFVAVWVPYALALDQSAESAEQTAESKKQTALLRELVELEKRRNT